MTENQEPVILFDQKAASAYDKRWAKLAPTRDALHLLIRAILSDLPANARVLCVGVGTGSELMDLALAFPEWQFTVLDPATPMLNVCRQRAEEGGITSRCTFHEGYLDSLPVSDQFDAATCLVVSHLILRPEERRRLFHQIALRLRPQGVLVNSEIAYDTSSPAYQSILNAWLQMLRAAEIPEEDIGKMRASLGREVAVVPPQEVESILGSGGFDTPTRFFQSLLIHAWYSRRTSSDQKS
ncbi:MAG: methyltransferase domain-containing protein [Cytophagales bacterium]|nr:methyltransferase domain-containing protein [Armatimonadota bacterium]